MIPRHLIAVTILAVAMMIAGSSRPATADGECDVCDDCPSLLFGTCRLRLITKAHEKIGEGGTGGWYMPNHEEGSFCGDCSVHMSCPGDPDPGEGGDEEPDQEDGGHHLGGAISSGDPVRLRDAVYALKEFAMIDDRSQRLIIQDCRGAITAQYLLSDAQLAALRA